MANYTPPPVPTITNAALESAASEIDTLSPEYQDLLNRAYAYAGAGDESGFESWLKTVRPDMRGQLIDDLYSVLHSHKVNLVKSLLGSEGVQRLNRTRKNDVLQAVAASQDIQALRTSLSSIDSGVQLKQVSNLAQWRDYAVRILRGISLVQNYMVKQEFDEYLPLLQRFRSWDKNRVQTLRKELEGVLRSQQPGSQPDKAALEVMERALKQSGFTQQLIQELLAREARARLLQTIQRLYVCLAVVDYFYDNNPAQEDALKDQLIALRLRRR